MNNHEKSFIKILVVDDSPTSCGIIKLCLDSSADDYKVYIANDRNEALKISKEISPDICLMDYNFPYDNGLDISKAIIALGVHTNFVLITADLQEQIVEDAEELGFVAIMEKPIEKETLLKMITELETC